MVLVTTFANEAGAEQFKSYTDKYGIWVSIQHPQRGPDDYKAEFHGVEYPVFKETHRGILYAKKRILAAEVRFWGKDADGTELQQNGDVYRGMEGMLLQWFKLEDGSAFREAREAGATRVIEVKGDSGTIERTVTAIKCSIEFIKVTSGGGSPVSTFLRFHSLRDAIRATHALKANGYEPMYGRDAADKPVSSSKWRQYYMAAEKALAEKKKKDLRDLVMSDD
ncbi:hypothetical protein BZA77DRAFT_307300 [Pyronema omphalodes]|nr:hypothetical protein BZA77DRAFT_307300 [Pyronema omphalodes]